MMELARGSGLTAHENKHGKTVKRGVFTLD